MLVHHGQGRTAGDQQYFCYQSEIQSRHQLNKSYLVNTKHVWFFEDLHISDGLPDHRGEPDFE